MTLYRGNTWAEWSAGLSSIETEGYRAQGPGPGPADLGRGSNNPKVGSTDAPVAQLRPLGGYCGTQQRRFAETLGGLSARFPALCRPRNRKQGASALCQELKSGCRELARITSSCRDHPTSQSERELCRYWDLAAVAVEEVRQRFWSLFNSIIDGAGSMPHTKVAHDRTQCRQDLPYGSFW